MVVASEKPPPPKVFETSCLCQSCGSSTGAVTPNGTQSADVANPPGHVVLLRYTGKLVTLAALASQP